MCNNLKFYSEDITTDMLMLKCWNVIFWVGVFNDYSPQVVDSYLLYLTLLSTKCLSTELPNDTMERMKLFFSSFATK